ncbi:Vsp/OspC family lipoprotein [Borrelia turicatae]|uniref:Vsp/OspC family lipoprotein n=1 Tax=Borrelia turicatae TaxID=142 RepID=UPI001FF5F14D|nr:Vsp/OspC family lipoprotein [Borrelia turicatae]UPA14293.1 hypothetical protein bt91E135_001475 [Borrelia turicatae 91E135]
MKRITLSALLMTLFLLISCNNSGTSPKDGQAAKSDGTVIDLATITNNIKDTVAFAKSVKEVHTLVMSIDEFANAIGKKLKKDTGEIEADSSSNNGPLVVGAYSIVSTVNTKLTTLETSKGISDELKSKITATKDKSKAFLDKVKGEDDLCKKEVTDDHLKKAILKGDATGDKGAKDLIALNTAVDALLKAANDAVESAIKELSTPAKSASTAQSN